MRGRPFPDAAAFSGRMGVLSGRINGRFSGQEQVGQCFVTVGGVADLGHGFEALSSALKTWLS